MEGKPREKFQPWRPRETQPGRTGLTWQQMAFLIGINAIIALGISVVVTLTLGRATPASRAPAPSPSPVPPVESPVAAAATTPTQPTTYTVKPGDSLSAIAFQFGISLQELMAANDITDPDVLFAGQKLVIPVPGSITPVPTPRPTVAPTGAATPIPTNTPPTGPDLRIESVQILPDERDSFAVITNWGMWARLKGWTLDDGQGNVFTFPDLSLFQGGSVRVHTAAGTNTEVDLYWGINKAVFVSGRTLTLKDATGKVVASYTVP
ncbi:MAG: LysM peptidoglycan-binding domain-containing protein [Chloroflexi bacterium]|nr:LysM peptidoglycan-binding domain-containing protein [Chloroflexota bacterium]